MGSLSEYKNMMFEDNDKFKYLSDGRIAYKTDRSSWSKIFEDNLPIDDRFHAILNPPKPCFQSLPKVEKIARDDKEPIRGTRLRLGRKKNKGKSYKVLTQTWLWDEDISDDICWGKPLTEKCCKNIMYFGDVCEKCGYKPSEYEFCYGCGYYNGTGDICFGCRHFG